MTIIKQNHKLPEHINKALEDAHSFFESHNSPISHTFLIREIKLMIREQKKQIIKNMFESYKIVDLEFALTLQKHNRRTKFTTSIKRIWNWMLWKIKIKR